MKRFTLLLFAAICVVEPTGENKGGMLKVLVTHSKIPQVAFDILSGKYELIVSEGLPHPSRETLLKDINGVDAVLWFGHIRVDKEMIEAAGPQLKAVSSMGAGYDHIDVTLLKEHNIKFSNTPNLLSSAVADMALGLALAVSRNILRGYSAIITDKWTVNHPTWMCGPALQGSTVGIVGLGAIGSKIASRIKSFEIGQLLYTNRNENPDAAIWEAKFVPLDLLLANSDFVFLAIPLTPETKHLLNIEKFKMMKSTSILINVSRGDVVNQDDLVTALQQNIIGGAGIDVFTVEPLPHDDILTTLPNAVLTPHLSSATFRAREAVARLAAENIVKFLSS